jgi:hypothetical protein
MAGPDHFDVVYEPSFERSLARIGLSLRVFESLCQHGIDLVLARNPYDEQGTRPIPGTDHRYLHTKDGFPDLPELLIAYEVDPINHQVRVIGAEPISGADDYPPP